ncbi:hypothetical protein [Streptomyces nodosus]|uniref:hypothetical protein n=1 Tax=Streptomyces nodosus TaxID=40318 RepID=UPI00382233A3
MPWANAAASLAAFAQAERDPAVLLSAFMVRGVDVLAAGSYFHAVRRVPPGHSLVLTPAGHRGPKPYRPPPLSSPSRTAP